MSATNPHHTDIDWAGELFDECVLPGCTNLVDSLGAPCRECRRAFGTFLRHTDGPARRRDVVAAELADRDAAVAAIYAARRISLDPVDGDERRNQTCWLCDERRTCVRVENRWECRSCRVIRP